MMIRLPSGSSPGEIRRTRIRRRGARGWVTTAVCPAPSGVYTTAYGRSGDSTRFDVSVVVTGLDGIETQVSYLASEGYFITAIGRDGTGTEGYGGYILVGTRAYGTATVRSAKVVRSDRADDIRLLFSEGYAIVGYIFKPASHAHLWSVDHTACA